MKKRKRTHMWNPKTVQYNGEVFRVEHDKNNNGEVQSFQVYDHHDFMVCEMDWVGDYTVEVIHNELDRVYNLAYFESDAVVPVVHDVTYEENTEKNASRTESKEVVFDDQGLPLGEYRALFTHYTGFPQEFYREAIEQVESFSNESWDFYEVIVSELAEYWDEV